MEDRPLPTHLPRWGDAAVGATARVATTVLGGAAGAARGTVRLGLGPLRAAGRTAALARTAAEVVAPEVVRRGRDSVGRLAEDGRRRREGLASSAEVRIRSTVGSLVAYVLDQVDLDAVAERLDVDAVARRLDVDAVAERLDLDRVAARLDVDAVVARADLDGAVARVDVEAILDRVDLVGIAQEVVDGIGLPDIVRESTGSLATETVEEVRLQGMAADDAVARLVDRIRLRRRPALPSAP
ncbi:MAG TPA: hypothetical protein VK908_06445 [Jiangellales bacterium]|nr:hypothetical protein [Jiangellales bacterium]